MGFDDWKRPVEREREREREREPEERDEKRRRDQDEDGYEVVARKQLAARRRRSSVQ